MMCLWWAGVEIMIALEGISFPYIRQVAVATYPPGATFGPRTLGDYEFVWIIDGDVTWDVDGITVPAPQSTILLGRPGMRDAFRWDQRRLTRHGFLHFGMTAKAGSLPAEHTWPLARNLPSQDIMRPLLAHLAWLQEQRPAGHEILIASALRHLLAVFISGDLAIAGERGTPFHAVIEQVLTHLRGRWERGPLVSVPLEALARVAGVSRGHLVRVFRRDLGVTPVEAQRLLRLERAASLLARTNLPVQEVSDLTGFDSPFHFSRVFRTIYGASPRTWRLRMDQGPEAPRNQVVLVRRLSGRVFG